MKYTVIQTRDLLLLVFFLFTFPFLGRGQAYEIDQVKMIPSVDEANMRLIALSVWALYDEAVKNPEPASTARAANEVVYAYYDTDFEGRHEKLKPAEGRKYGCGDRKDLDSNNRLLFNLRFDSYGNLIVPDSIYVISNRLEERDGKIYMLGMMSLGLKVTDVVREKLSHARLERIVRSRIALAGEYPAVEVIVPFNLARRQASRLITGRVLINDGHFDFIPEPQSAMGENEQEVLKSLEEQIACKMLQYKKGDFIFLTEHKMYSFQIDLNIRRNTVWHSQQTKNFTIDTYQALNFTASNNGEKTKHFLNSEKSINSKLAQMSKPKK